jgi:hypothetical protein
MPVVAGRRSAMMDEQARRLLDAAGSVLGELDVEIVIDSVLESARELTGARYAAVGVLDCTLRRVSGGSCREGSRALSVGNG